jgi:hypothetical protein
MTNANHTHAVALGEDGLTFEVHSATCSHLSHRYFADEPHFVTAESGEQAAADFKARLAEDQQGFKFDIYKCAK